MMNIDFGSEEETLVFWEDEPMTDEEEAAASWAFIRQMEAEAYAEFLDAPNCFD